MCKLIQKTQNGGRLRFSLQTYIYKRKTNDIFRFPFFVLYARIDFRSLVFPFIYVYIGCDRDKSKTDKNRIRQCQSDACVTSHQTTSLNLGASPIRNNTWPVTGFLISAGLSCCSVETIRSSRDIKEYFTIIVKTLVGRFCPCQKIGTSLQPLECLCLSKKLVSGGKGTPFHLEPLLYRFLCIKRTTEDLFPLFVFFLYQFAHKTENRNRLPFSVFCISLHIKRKNGKKEVDFVV